AADALAGAAEPQAVRPSEVLTVSRTSSVLLGLAAGVAVFGLLIPYVMVHWALLYLLSLGAAPSPRWGLVTIAALLALVGWLTWKKRSSAFLRSMFVGGLAGLV